MERFLTTGSFKGATNELLLYKYKKEADLQKGSLLFCLKGKDSFFFAWEKNVVLSDKSGSFEGEKMPYYFLIS